MKEALAVIDRISVPIDVDNDDEMLALKTSIGIKFVVRWPGLMGKLSLQAVHTVEQIDAGLTTKWYAHVEKVPGGEIIHAQQEHQAPEDEKDREAAHHPSQLAAGVQEGRELDEHRAFEGRGLGTRLGDRSKSRPYTRRLSGSSPSSSSLTRAFRTSRSNSF